MSDHMQDWTAELRDSDIPSQYQDFIDVIGVESTIALADRLGGMAFYLPRPDRLKGIVMERRIKRDRTQGLEYREIARKYKCTENWVRQVCDHKAQSEPDNRQGKLF